MRCHSHGSVLVLLAALLGTPGWARANFLALDVSPTSNPLEFVVDVSLVMTSDATIATFDAAVSVIVVRFT